MSTVEINTGAYIKRFEFWNPETWAIPKLYWDAWSIEQRTHAICRQLEKVIAYADYLGVNVDDIASRLKAIEDGQLNEFIIEKIEEWFDENEPWVVTAIETLTEKTQENERAIEKLSESVAVNKTKILAHRGLSTISTWIYSIDNSLWSFMGALANGFDGFECDVRKDANGALVMIHDRDVSSVSNSSGYIDQLDYTQVNYKTKKMNVTTDTHLTTIVEMAKIVKSFNAFCFVESKEHTITAQEISDYLVELGLGYHNFGVFRDNDTEWFEDAIQLPHVKVGYHTEDFTATPAEMMALQNICDQYNKPYDEIIVRCLFPEQVQYIKMYGFLSSLDATTSENEINYDQVDYAIAERRWNGEQDANTNYKGTPYRVFYEESDNYSSLKDYVNGIASKIQHGNMLFGRIRGTNLNTWLTALGYNTFVSGSSNGATVYGYKDREFACGLIHIYRTNNTLLFNLEYDPETFLVTPLSVVPTSKQLTKSAIQGIIAAHSNISGSFQTTGYMTAADVTSLINKSDYYGANVSIECNNQQLTATFIPINLSKNEIAIYRYNFNSSSSNVITIVGS